MKISKVVFEEDSPEVDQFGQNNAPESMEMNMNAGMDIDMDVERRQELTDYPFNVRDHRPVVRNVFSRCFTGNTPKGLSFGDILAEYSDEEQ